MLLCVVTPFYFPRFKMVWNFLRLVVVGLDITVQSVVHINLGEVHAPSSGFLVIAKRSCDCEL